MRDKIRDGTVITSRPSDFISLYKVCYHCRCRDCRFKEMTTILTKRYKDNLLVKCSPLEKELLILKRFVPLSLGNYFVSPLVLKFCLIYSFYLHMNI